MAPIGAACIARERCVGIGFEVGSLGVPVNRHVRVSAFVAACTLGAAGTTVHADGAWDGFYAGLNGGEARNSTCSNWTLNGAITDPAVRAAFAQRNCPNNSAGVFGFQFGYNFGGEQLIWGLGADYDIWGNNSTHRSFVYTGAVPPPGTYSFSGKLTPSGLGVFGPRIGYAWQHVMPYLRAGGALAGGSHGGTLTYVPEGTPAARPGSFSAGKNFTSFGWAAGGGVEFVLNGPWTIKAEYLHASFGRGSNSQTSCTGSAATCAALAGFSLDSTHNSLTADIVRIGFNYWFSY